MTENISVWVRLVLNTKYLGQDTPDFPLKVVVDTKPLFLSVEFEFISLETWGSGHEADVSRPRTTQWGSTGPGSAFPVSIEVWP